MAAKKKRKYVSNPARAVATTSIPSKVREDGKVGSDDAVICDTPECPVIEAVNVNSLRLSGSDKQTSEKLIVDMTSEELVHHLAQAELQNFVDQYHAKSLKEASRQAAKLVSERRLSRQAADRLQSETWLTEELITRIFDADTDPSDQELVLDTTNTVPLPRDESEILATIWTVHEVLSLLGLRDRDAALVFVLERWSSLGLIQPGEMLLGLEEALVWYARSPDLDNVLQYDKVDHQTDHRGAEPQDNTLKSGMLLKHGHCIVQ